MTITDMALPDEVVEAAWAAYNRGPAIDDMKSAIRAALQAMLDNGMAEIRTTYHPVTSDNFRAVLAIRLDADEREPALQEERK